MGRSSDYEVEKLDFRESAALLTDGPSVGCFPEKPTFPLISKKRCANGVPKLESVTDSQLVTHIF